MGEVADRGCLIEAIMASNGNEDGAEIEAAQILKSKFDSAANPLGSTALTEITCDRCNVAFFLGEETSGRRARVHISESNEDGKECDRTIEGRNARKGQWVLNVNLRNVAQRG